MEFEFVKLKLTNPEIKYGWMVVLDCMERLNAFMEICQYKIIEEGFSKYVSKSCEMHCTHPWEYAVEVCAYMKGTSFLTESIKLENNLYTSRAHSILKYGRLYLNENGSGFPHIDNLEVMESIIRGKLRFPQHSEKDIKIERWPGGKHYYAKLGNVDIVINGCQRWNTPEAARMAAKEFLDIENKDK